MFHYSWYFIETAKSKPNSTSPMAQLDFIAMDSI